MNINKLRLSTSLIALTSTLFFSGCATENISESNSIKKESGAPEQEASLHDMIKQSSANNKEDILKGVDLIIAKDYKAASSHFNSVLMDAPEDANIHFLNAVTYQMMGETSGGEKYELAAAGFVKALEYEPTLWPAFLHLGQVLLKQKKYNQAKEAFANVILFQEDHVEALYGLAMASYYTQDLKHAHIYINKASQASKNRSDICRSAAIINAAAGNKQQANEFLATLKKDQSSVKDIRYVTKRLEDWEKIHASGSLLKARETANAFPELKGADNHDQVLAAEIEAAPAAAAPSDPHYGPPDMVLIDGVVMRVSEQGKTQKGNNFMDLLGLTLEWGRDARTNKSLTPGFGREYQKETVRRFNPVLGLFNSSGSATNYNLGIANTYRQHFEVIGRPTIAVTVGSQGEFYSGDDRHLPIQGDRGGSIEKLPVGISIKVTPTAINGDMVTLKVEMKGASVLTDPAVATDSYLITANSYVTTEVKARIGESTVIGGIKLRSTNGAKEGFPVLENIPGIQLLFSDEETDDLRRTVMYMITVRGYGQDINNIKQKLSDPKVENTALKELDDKNKSYGEHWFGSQSTSLLMLKDLAPLHREFRNGDVLPLQYHFEGNPDNVLRATAPFIWY